MNFKVNDKVVRIKTDIKFGSGSDQPSNYKTIGAVPILGSVYVVEKVIELGALVGLALVGSSSVHIATGIETGWDHRQFRKLEEVQNDNEILAREKDFDRMLKEATELINLY